MNPFRAGAGWVLAVAIGVVAACSGDEFENTGSGGSAGTADGSSGSGGTTGGGGNGGGTGGTDASAGTGGGGMGGSGASDGGSAGTGAAAGSGGAPPCTDGSCAADEYCHSDGSCRKCLDTDEFDFGQAEAIAAVNAGHTVSLRAPRPADSPVQILYVAGDYYTQRKIWYTDNADQNAGLALPDPIDTVADGGDLGENSPLVTMPTADGALKGLGFFFDRTVAPTVLPGRRLWGAPVDAAGKIGAPVELPMPFNTLSDSAWEIAFAPLAQRVWFMSNREGGFTPKLYTTPTNLATAPAPTAVSLFTAPHNCKVEQNLAESELSPWVTVDGGLMFFHTRETAAGCTYGGKTDIFIVPLKPDGQMSGISAFPLPVNEPNTNDMTPSMSWDMCWLYFSSDRELSDKLKLYRARRK